MTRQYQFYSIFGSLRFTTSIVPLFYANNSIFFFFPFFFFQFCELLKWWSSIRVFLAKFSDIQNMKVKKYIFLITLFLLLSSIVAIFGDSFYYCSRFLSIFLRILDRIFLFQNNFRKMAKSQFAYIYLKIIGSPSCEISPKKIPWSLRVCTHSDNNGGRPSSSHCLLDRSVGRCNCFLMLWMLVMCYVSFPNFFCCCCKLNIWIYQCVNLA